MISDIVGTRNFCRPSAFACGHVDLNDRQMPCRNGRSHMVFRPCDFANALEVAMVLRTFSHKHHSCALICVSIRALPMPAYSRTPCHSKCIFSPIANQYCDVSACVAINLMMSHIACHIHSKYTVHPWATRDYQQVQCRHPPPSAVAVVAFYFSIYHRRREECRRCRRRPSPRTVR